VVCEREAVVVCEDVLLNAVACEVSEVYMRGLHIWLVGCMAYILLSIYVYGVY